MRLALIVEEIVNATPEHALTEQMLYASLDFLGPKNSRLAIPTWHTHKFRNLDMERHEFLTGDEEIAGDVLIFSYCSHDGAMVLREYSTLSDAEGYVLGGSGVFNVYTDCVLVFEHFRIKPYRVSYKTKSGARSFFVRERWDKANRPFPERRLEWI
jgi:hypothetical protein